jgi:hypothetical protein
VQVVGDVGFVAREADRDQVAVLEENRVALDRALLAPERVSFAISVNSIIYKTALYVNNKRCEREGSNFPLPF